MSWISLCVLLFLSDTRHKPVFEFTLQYTHKNSVSEK